MAALPFPARQGAVSHSLVVLKRFFCPLVFSGVLVSGCGGIDAIRLRLAFPDDETQAATQAVLLVVHAPANSTDSACDTLWSVDPMTYPNRSILEYPNANDVLAAPIALKPYPELSFISYAFPGKDFAFENAIAGGCRNVVTKLAEDEDVVIKLERAP